MADPQYRVTVTYKYESDLASTQDLVEADANDEGCTYKAIYKSGGVVVETFHFPTFIRAAWFVAKLTGFDFLIAVRLYPA